jgi:hypothetical protein
VFRLPAAIDTADDRLVSPGRHIVGRRGKAQLTGIVFDATLKLRVIAEGDERAAEPSRIQDGVADSRIQEG